MEYGLDKKESKALGTSASHCNAGGGGDPMNQGRSRMVWKMDGKGW